MKTVFIPRDAYETYFMPAPTYRPTAKETAAYLSARHPLYGPTCYVDCHRCRIAGRNFVLLTVLNCPAKSFRREVGNARIVTVPAILASSNLASNPCTIRCGGELIIFGLLPELIEEDPSKDGKTKVDHDFASEIDLLDFATKEGIRVSLFSSHWRIPASILTVILCIVLTAFMASPSAVTIPIRKNIVMGTVPAITGTSFPDFFSAVIEAIAANNSVIEEYRFSSKENDLTLLAIKNGNPETLRFALSSIPSLANLTIQDLRYADGTWHYSVRFSSGIASAGMAIGAGVSADEKLQTFNMVHALEKLCIPHQWQLSAASAASPTSLPILSIKVPSSSFSLFPTAFFRHCSENNLIITEFRAGRKDGNNTFMVELGMAKGGTENEKSLPKPDLVSSAFDLYEKQYPPTVRTSAVSRTGMIGKIKDSTRGVFVFSKTPAGKITLQKENER